MGNLTPRILRAINVLNFEMAAINGQSALRRVHHNAESHRNAAFGALTSSEMSDKGDGFPLTAFHPTQALRPGSSLVRYADTVTLLTMGEFREYCSDVLKAGYYVPKNWTWGMSIRDSANQSHGFLNR